MEEMLFVLRFDIIPFADVQVAISGIQMMRRSDVLGKNAIRIVNVQEKTFATNSDVCYRSKTLVALMRTVHRMRSAIKENVPIHAEI